VALRLMLVMENEWSSQYFPAASLGVADDAEDFFAPAAVREAHFLQRITLCARLPAHKHYLLIQLQRLPP
jgi:hypothetical protein